MEYKKKIKLSFVISGSEIGGSEKMVLLMAESLPAETFSPPVVFAIKGTGKFTEELSRKSIRNFVFNLKANPFEFIRLFRAVRKESPDIIHSFLFYGNLAGRITGRLLKTPAVISSQRSTDPWRTKLHWLADGFTSRWADLIISNSFAGKKALTEKAGIPVEKIEVIPNGIKFDKASVAYRREDFGIKASERIVGTVGNLRSPKGHKHLVSAAPLILKKFPNVRFMIVGEGDLKRKLVEQAEKTGVAERFVFAGFIPSAAEVINLFDVFAFPSLWEGCPVSLLEAMGRGKPCAAFSVGDIPFIIEDGVNGLLIPPESPEKLAEGIISLLEDGKRSGQMGENAKKRVETEFSFDAMMRKYTAAYEKAVDLKRKKG